MGAPTTQFLSALRDVFGPTQNSSASNAAAFASVVATPGTGGRIEVYGIDLVASAIGVGTWQLVDATATGVGGSVRWQTLVIPTSLSHDFSRPLYFTKGLLINYTATAANTLTHNVQFSQIAPGQ